MARAAVHRVVLADQLAAAPARGAAPVLAVEHQVADQALRVALAHLAVRDHRAVLPVALTELALAVLALKALDHRHRAVQATPTHRRLIHHQDHQLALLAIAATQPAADLIIQDRQTEATRPDQTR